MLENYFTTIIRNLLSSRLYSVISVTGLAIGLAAAILIAMFVRFELSYDKQWDGISDTYRIEAWSAFSGPGEPRSVAISAAVMPLLRDNFVEVTDAFRLYYDNIILKRDDQAFREVVTYADPSFANHFTLPMIEGDLSTALSDPAQIVLSESMALKYFGTSNVLGETLQTSEGRVFSIAAIMQDLPENTHLQIDMIAAFDTLAHPDHARIEERLNWSTVQTYVVFDDATNVAQFEANLPNALNRLVPSPDGPNSDTKLSDLLRYYFTSVPDIHLYSDNGAGAQKATSDIGTVISFSVVSILILAIASINFINLATARSITRAKEVGIRKVLGASRKHLITQFITESVFITLIALLIAVSAVELILPYYGEFLDLPLVGQGLFDPGFLLGILSLGIAVGVGGGIYPAFFLSSYRPSRVIRSNKSSESVGSARLRTSLVIIQFAISITLIIITAVVYGQTLYAKNMDLGYNMENVLIVRGIRGEGVPTDTLVQEIERMPQVLSTTRGMSMPADRANARWNIARKEPGTNDTVFVAHQSIDYNFFDSFGISLVAGRQFSEEFGAESFKLGDDSVGYAGPIVINETAARSLGFASPSDALGVRISLEPGQSQPEAEIIGVIADIHQNSAREDIRPWMFYYRPNSDNNLAVRFNSGDGAAVQAQVQKMWSQMVPARPYNAQLLEENIETQYRAEDSRAIMFMAFSILAIIIAALGLFGLASYSATRRTKEIGIRKVLGATILDMVRLLVWQFSLPVLLANIIAWPIAWYQMNDWLNGFAYRIELDILPFLLASAIALMIAWVTVCSHAIKIARRNPIEALRYE